MKVNGVTLDWKAREVLAAIEEYGGVANTTDIKQYTGIERNPVVHYRYDKLEDAGLVEVRVEPVEGERYKEINVARMTEDGWELCEEYEYRVEIRDDGMEMREKVERLEKMVEMLRDEMFKMRQDVAEMQSN